MSTKVSNGLTAKQEKGISALLTSPTLATAAKQLRVNERTLIRWLDDPAFKSAYDVARRGLIDDALKALQQMALESTEVIRAVMKDEKQTGATRIQAVRALWETLFKSDDLADLQRRIEVLEALYEQSTKSQSSAA